MPHSVKVSWFTWVIQVSLVWFIRLRQGTSTTYCIIFEKRIIRERIVLPQFIWISKLTDLVLKKSISYNKTGPRSGKRQNVKIWYDMKKWSLHMITLHMIQFKKVPTLQLLCKLYFVHPDPVPTLHLLLPHLVHLLHTDHKIAVPILNPHHQPSDLRSLSNTTTFFQ